MGLNIIFTKPDERLIKVPVDYELASVKVYPRYKEGGAEYVSGTYLKDWFKAYMKAKYKLDIIIRNNDVGYWLYPDVTVAAARRFIPGMYHHPTAFTPDGSKYTEGSDCDNKSFEWLRVMWHWSLAGCPIVSFVGIRRDENKVQTGHYYCATITLNRNIIWLNGNPEGLYSIHTVDI